MTNLTTEFTPMMNALKTLKKVIPTRCAIPIMEHVTVTSDSFGRAVLTASDLESWLSITVDGSQVEESEGVLQGAEQGSELELELPLQPDKSKGHIKVPRPPARPPPLALRGFWPLALSASLFSSNRWR